MQKRWKNSSILLNKDERRRTIFPDGIFAMDETAVWFDCPDNRCIEKKGAKDAPDVSWNKPFKERIRHFYNTWMSNDAEKAFTLAGNPKAPALHVVLDWIHRSWQEISKDVIIKSFEVCGLTTPLDGTGDEKIACFKPEGAIGPIGTKFLREFRENETVKDGQNDHEEAGLSDDDGDVELDGVGDNDEFFICISPCHTTSVNYKIRLQLFKSIELKFESVNERTKEQMTLVKEGERGKDNVVWLLERCKIVGMAMTVQWEDENLNNVHFMFSEASCIG
ncbi:hypothetical protein niasHT_004941 [Heterodera trifolii]|uniref:DDE-1 domain-containing protein n=1 Tax=Heterodera trifolii TaxID=157864 RepID=A0ABD2M8K2_9BILA